MTSINPHRTGLTLPLGPDGRTPLALADGVTQVLSAPASGGAYLHFAAPVPAPVQTFPACAGDGLVRLTCLYRYDPFWMKPVAANSFAGVPSETQFLLAEWADGNYVVFVPLIDHTIRCSLKGGADNLLTLVCESGDGDLAFQSVTGLYVAAGDDPYELVRTAAAAVQRKLGVGRLRTEKPVPAFADKFGWCTWDAFYGEVSEEKVDQGLASFARGRIRPRVVVLDDGWQCLNEGAGKETRLTSFAPNSKFPGGLTSTIRRAKEVHGVETFLVWHAITGFWGGVDAASFPQYETAERKRDFGPGILEHDPNQNLAFGWNVGVIAPSSVAAFFNDWHRSLREQGADGVKVDGQAVLEGLGTGFGGRVEIMRAYREALEGSAAVHFGGNLINCMSCSNDMLFQTLASNLTRTSTDFWPNDPASHGLHLYTNAQVSLFWGEFVLPDWDMFQSSHSAGAFHAAGRAVGGCPVYVSDKPGAHDFELLRKLTLPDGTTLRALDPGRPTRDCLFHDPTREDVLLKIFNNNPASAVVGVFNAHPRMGEGEERVTEGMVSPADISGQAGDKHAVWSHAGGELRVLRHHESWPVSLPPLGFEIFTIAPIVDGLAPVGLVDYFNSGGAVRGRRRLPEGWTEIEAVAGGRFVVWCAFEPVSILEDGHPAAFKFDAGTGQLTLLLEGTGPRRLAIHLAVQ